MPGDREHCLAVGMDGYLSKPLSSEKLFAEIERLLCTPEHPVCSELRSEAE